MTDANSKHEEAVNFSAMLFVKVSKQGAANEIDGDRGSSRRMTCCAEHPPAFTRTCVVVGEKTELFSFI
jgi:hypothetical protein